MPLARLFENLLDHALRHGKGDRIRVFAVRSADWAAITVANPAEEWGLHSLSASSTGDAPAAKEVPAWASSSPRAW